MKSDSQAVVAVGDDHLLRGEFRHRVVWYVKNIPTDMHKVYQEFDSARPLLENTQTMPAPSSPSCETVSFLFDRPNAHEN
jgi:hypothetical protein